MKYRHILNPVTEPGKLHKLVSSYRWELACGKISNDSKVVAENLLWFDQQNSKFQKPSKKVTKLIANIWAHYCQ